MSEWGSTVLYWYTPPSPPPSKVGPRRPRYGRRMEPQATATLPGAPGPTYDGPSGVWTATPRLEVHCPTVRPTGTPGLGGPQRPVARGRPAVTRVGGPRGSPSGPPVTRRAPPPRRPPTLTFDGRPAATSASGPLSAGVVGDGRGACPGSAPAPSRRRGPERHVLSGRPATSQRGEEALRAPGRLDGRPRPTAAPPGPSPAAPSVSGRWDSPSGDGTAGSPTAPRPTGAPWS